MATQVRVNTGSGNGLLPNGTKPSSEPVVIFIPVDLACQIMSSISLRNHCIGVTLAMTSQIIDNAIVCSTAWSLPCNQATWQLCCFAPCSMIFETWWRHQMETFSALLALCAGNSPVTGEFPSQRPVTRSFDVFLDLHLSKQSWGWWFETPSRSLWRHSNEEAVAALPHVFYSIADLHLSGGTHIRRSDKNAVSCRKWKSYMHNSNHSFRKAAVSAE